MSDKVNIYTNDEITKLGQTLIYLSKKAGLFTKTKALKLLYFLDEVSIKKYGVPFIGLKYEVWQFGPVAQDVFIDLSDSPIMLKDYIKISKEFVQELNCEVTYIDSVQEFSDDEFTDNDMEVLDYVIDNFGHRSAFELSELTHKESSLWYQLAKENNLLFAFENGLINSSNCIIDFTKLLDTHKSDVYKNYIKVKHLERSFNV